MSVCVILLIFGFASCERKEEPPRKPDTVTIQINTVIVHDTIGDAVGFDWNRCKYFSEYIDMAGCKEIAEIEIVVLKSNGSFDATVKDIKGDVYYVKVDKDDLVFRIHKDNRDGEILWHRGFQ
jgi:hypothetical protein